MAKRIIEKIKNDSLLRELDITSGNINPKANGWAKIEISAPTVLNIVDDLTENLKDYPQDLDDGETQGQITLYVLNDDNTSTVSFEHNGVQIPIINSEKVNPSLRNVYFLMRTPFAGGDIKEVFQIYVMEPLIKPTV